MLIDSAALVAALRDRGRLHQEAVGLPRQSLPDRLRREGSAQTCRMIADDILIGRFPIARAADASALPFVCRHADPRCKEGPCPWGLARFLCNAPAGDPARLAAEVSDNEENGDG